VTGRDVTPNLLTHLASPDAQVIHRHSLASQLLMPSTLRASSPSRVYRHRLRKGSKRVLIKSRAGRKPPQWNGLRYIPWLHSSRSIFLLQQILSKCVTTHMSRCLTP
jgi:hypothetical protein